MTVERPLDGKLILIVEDDYFQADDARRALEAAGAKVLGPFADEIAGVKALHTGSPHCAVLDINLGLGPSLEIARSASALGAPIVFMTGYDEQQIAPEFIRVERHECVLEAIVGVRRQGLYQQNVGFGEAL
jgi:DNA-binding NarL/FixJ family response regulator